MASVLRSYFWLLAGFLCVFKLGAQIPKIGSDDRLDVMTWNVEWFGSSSNGPTNDDLQLTYVTDIINTIDVDLIAVQEISDVAYWNRLLFNCQDYSGVLSTWNQTQKTGLLYKKEDFDFLYQKHILPNYEYDFGGGRLPLEVGLMPKHPNWRKTDTLRIWVLHMKANTGSTSSKVLAYNRRYNSGLALKLYIDNLGKHNKGVVLGDWNDDFDQSILTGYASPYQNWIKDTNYVVNSYGLSLSKQRSTVGYSDMIDHIVSSPGMKLDVIRDSTMVLYADKWISNYGNIVSDHYPVYSRFHWNESNSMDIERFEIAKFRIIEREGSMVFEFGSETGMSNLKLDIYDFNGRLIHSSDSNIFSGVRYNRWYFYQIQDLNNRGMHSGAFLALSSGEVLYR